MKTHSTIAAFVTALAAVLPASAQAQYYGQAQVYAQPAPLYPYAVQQQPNAYIVQPAPNGYVIQQQAAPRAYPYARTQRPTEPDVMADYRRHQHQHNDHALIEELRKRSHPKQTVINTEQVVRDPPVIIEKKRVVQDPPVVIERRHYVEDAPAKPSRRSRAAVVERDQPALDKGSASEKSRVIRAEAEVTILGPDRMSIRLFRKARGTDANARAE
jgi:hypothetical protein